MLRSSENEAPVVEEPAADGRQQKIQQNPRAETNEPAEALAELRQTVLAYFRQEALDPLKRLGAWLGFGLLGGVFISTGLVLLALGALRALQTETAGHLSGSLSWTPYVIVLAVVLLLFMLARSAARARRRGAPEKGT